MVIFLSIGFTFALAWSTGADMNVDHLNTVSGIWDGSKQASGGAPPDLKLRNSPESFLPGGPGLQISPTSCLTITSIGFSTSQSLPPEMKWHLCGKDSHYCGGLLPMFSLLSKPCHWPFLSALLFPVYQWFLNAFFMFSRVFLVFVFFARRIGLSGLATVTKSRSALPNC